MIGHLLGHLIGHTRTGQFLNMGLMLLFVLMLPVVVVIGLSVAAWREVSMESSYQGRYGAEWKNVYEEHHGSLKDARIKLAVELAGAVIVGGIGVWVYRVILPALPHTPRRSRRRSRRRRTSVENAPPLAARAIVIAPATTAVAVPAQAPPAPPRIKRPMN